MKQRIGEAVIFDSANIEELRAIAQWDFADCAKATRLFEVLDKFLGERTAFNKAFIVANASDDDMCLIDSEMNVIMLLLGQLQRFSKAKQDDDLIQLVVANYRTQLEKYAMTINKFRLDNGDYALYLLKGKRFADTSFNENDAPFFPVKPNRIISVNPNEFSQETSLKKFLDYISEDLIYRVRFNLASLVAYPQYLSLVPNVIKREIYHCMGITTHLTMAVGWHIKYEWQIVDIMYRIEMYALELMSFLLVCGEYDFFSFNPEKDIAGNTDLNSMTDEGVP